MGHLGCSIVKNGQTHIALANTDKNIFIDICSSEHVPGEVVEKIAQNIFVIDQVANNDFLCSLQQKPLSEAKHKEESKNDLPSKKNW